MFLDADKLALLSARASGSANDVLTFEAIYTLWFHEVSRWVRAFGGFEADLDDLTQAVFRVVRRKLPSFDGKNLKRWLYGIAKSEVRAYRRRVWVRQVFRRVGPAPDAEQVQVPSEDTSDRSEAMERRDVERFVFQTLRKMSQVRQTVFVLFEIEGLSGEEIAELEGIPLNAVWTRLDGARRRFFELIDEARTAGRLP